MHHRQPARKEGYVQFSLCRLYLQQLPFRLLALPQLRGNIGRSLMTDTRTKGTTMKRLALLSLALLACGESPTGPLPYDGPVRITYRVETVADGGACRQNIDVIGEGQGAITFTGAHMTHFAPAGQTTFQLSAEWVEGWLGTTTLTGDQSVSTWIGTYPDSLRLALLHEGGEAVVVLTCD